MVTPSTPPAPPGITWRPLTLEDADRLHELYDAFESGGCLDYRTSRDEVVHLLEAPSIDLAVDTLAAVDPSGAIRAAITTSLRSSAAKHRTFLFSLSRPGDEALERSLIEWGEERARQRMSHLDDGAERLIRGWAESAMPDRISMYESLGFRVVRYFVEMIRDLGDPIPEIVLPTGVQLVDWDPSHSSNVHEASNEAFADHWGSVPMDATDWERSLAYPGVRLDLSALALSDGDVVAFSLAGVYPEDWSLRGRKEAWVDSLGTKRAWRKQGLATALLLDAMRRFRAEGVDYAALGVDAESPTGAFGLYTKVGFVETTRSVALVKAW